MKTRRWHRFDCSSCLVMKKIGRERWMGPEGEALITTNGKERRTEMSIRIETRKEVRDDGVVGRRILKIEALPEKDVPVFYQNGKRPAVWSYNEGRSLYSKTGANLNVDDFLSEERFQERLEYVRQAGQHLSDVNAELKRKRDGWNGEETFVV